MAMYISLNSISSRRGISCASPRSRQIRSRAAELFKHQVSGRHVRAHQARNAVQSVEKKVGIEIRSDCIASAPVRVEPRVSLPLLPSLEIADSSQRPETERMRTKRSPAHRPIQRAAEITPETNTSYGGIQRGRLGKQRTHIISSTTLRTMLSGRTPAIVQKREAVCNLEPKNHHNTQQISAHRRYCTPHGFQ